MSLPHCGKELEVQSYPTPATGRPYPPNGPGNSRGTRVYLPLCGEELEVQSYTAPPRGVNIPHTAQARPEGLGCPCRYVGRSCKFKNTRPPPRDVPIPETAQARPEGLGCMRRCLGSNWRFNHTRPPPTERPYPPNGPRRNGGMRVSPPMCGEELETQSYTALHGVCLSPKRARARLEGLRYISHCVGRNRRFNHTRPPHGASPCPKRPGQDRCDSGVSAVVWGGAEGSITPDPQRGPPYA